MQLPTLSLPALIPTFFLFTHCFLTFCPYQYLQCSPIFTCVLPSFLSGLSGIRHLIVMWVEANRRVKKTTQKHCIVIVQNRNSRREHSEKPHTHRHPDVSVMGAEAECSKLCLWLFMCVSVCFWQVRGHIVLYSCTLFGTVTSRSQSLAILGPNHCQRSRSTSAKVLFIPLLLLFSLLLCIITQVIVE